MHSHSHSHMVLEDLLIGPPLCKTNLLLSHLAQALANHTEAVIIAEKATMEGVGDHGPPMEQSTSLDSMHSPGSTGSSDAILPGMMGQVEEGVPSITIDDGSPAIDHGAKGAIALTTISEAVDMASSIDNLELNPITITTTTTAAVGVANNDDAMNVEDYDNDNTLLSAEELEEVYQDDNNIRRDKHFFHVRGGVSPSVVHEEGLLFDDDGERNGTAEEEDSVVSPSSVVPSIIPRKRMSSPIREEGTDHIEDHTVIVIDEKTPLYEFGSAENANLASRSYMEDTHIVVSTRVGHAGDVNDDNNINSSGSSKDGFFAAVFDGHGGESGHLVAQKAVENFYDIFQLSMSLHQNQSIEEVLMDTFLDFDESVSNFMDIGCTACVAYMDPTSGLLYVAGVGDSRAVLIHPDGRAQRLTTDHKHTIPTELARIKAAGGRVKGGYVMAPTGEGLAMSRSMGDFAFKQGEHGKTIVIGIPEIHHLERPPLGSCLVVASDGLWDMLEDDEVGEMVHSRATWKCSSLATYLVGKALERGSGDNTTAIVIRFTA